VQTVIQPILESINAITYECKALLTQASSLPEDAVYAKLKSLAGRYCSFFDMHVPNMPASVQVRINHALLNALGVGHAALDTVVALTVNLVGPLSVHALN
jgi:mevalonate kinase